MNAKAPAQAECTLCSLADTSMPSRELGALGIKSTRVRAKGTVACHRRATRARMFILQEPRALYTHFTHA